MATKIFFLAGALCIAAIGCGDCNTGIPQEIDPAPLAATQPPSEVSTMSATLNGRVNPQGFPTTWFFEWGQGTLDNVTPSQSAGSGVGDVGVQAQISGLLPGTTYSYRVVAVNANGTARGAILTVTTEEALSFLALAGHGYDEDVDLIDIDTMTVLGTIVGAGGYRMVLSNDLDTLYSTGGDSLAYISDVPSLQLLEAFDPSSGNSDLTSEELEPVAISPDGSRVYYMDEQGYSGLFVLDTATNQVIDMVAYFEDEPENAVVSPDGAFLYVVDNSNALKIDLSTLEIVDRAPVGSDAHGVALNADGTQLYAKDTSTSLRVIDTATMTQVTTIADAGNGYYMELGADGVRLYSVNEGTQLSVIDTTTNTLIQNVTLRNSDAAGVTTTPDGKTVLVALRNNGGLIKLDAETLQETGFLEGSYQSVVAKIPASAAVAPAE